MAEQNLRPPRRHWLRLTARTLGLMLGQPQRTAQLVRQSYDRIAAGYDQAWTHHMRDLSANLLDRLAPPAGATCLDLTCGTGYVTGELARRTGGRVTGVDRSAGMLEIAQCRHRHSCTFVQADILEHLRSLPPSGFDVVTCAWGLGYSRPFKVVRQIARVLRPGGRLGIIDNSLFSLSEILWASMCAFAERPEALTHAMRVHFLPSPGMLGLAMRTAGLAVKASWQGRQSYLVPDGSAAIARLTATGAAAGFEFASNERYREQVFDRFARILERQRQNQDGIAITHRYLAAIGAKP
ncbi:MAG TPA: methyltransferase domain-containing protein [Phycisphaerae bacterium]|nr:methyltransferase domain-containing protein [Phycisphaerae bacterium]HRY69216.1 methyltransferase domain-containing protein [Phycisphaerae bacterium]HSA26177.1 methyltransferase domain-containing protein [Phycisphaerae bacterium]